MKPGSIIKEKKNSLAIKFKQKRTSNHIFTPWMNSQKLIKRLKQGDLIEFHRNIVYGFGYSVSYFVTDLNIIIEFHDSTGAST